jgi:type 1 glutamine amidotransferase
MANDYIVIPAPKGGIQPPDKEWITRIEALAPEKPAAEPLKPRKVLVFSLATGFQHTVAPHVKEVVKVLGKETGAYEAVFSDEVGAFKSESLRQFDAVLLNNVCPDKEKRDLFYDVLKDEGKAAQLESSLLDYVKGGGGLAVIHGAIAFQIHSPEVSGMMGGSFDRHPEFQRVTLELAEPEHPLAAAFDGKGYVHYDEPYLFKNAYAKKNFRPLLVLDVSKLNEKTRADTTLADDVRYAAWIKPHGRGRVFFCSPSHHPASYESEAMLRFLLDGIQYVLGDLKCDDMPAAR